MNDPLPNRPAWHESAYPIPTERAFESKPNFLIRGIGYLAGLATDRLEFFTQLPGRESNPEEVRAFEARVSEILDTH